MFCTKCGASLTQGKNFCSSCGNPVQQGANSSAAESVAVSIDTIRQQNVSAQPSSQQGQGWMSGTASPSGARCPRCGSMRVSVSQGSNTSEIRELLGKRNAEIIVGVVIFVASLVVMALLMAFTDASAKKPIELVGKIFWLCALGSLGTACSAHFKAKKLQAEDAAATTASCGDCGNTFQVSC